MIPGTLPEPLKIGRTGEGTLPVWVGYCRHGPQPAQFESGGASRSGGYGDEEEGVDHQDDEDKNGDEDTYRSGGYGDEEEGVDHQDDEDKNGDEDT
nr:hypothetical protein [Tanacetum cinerariifolium]